MEFTFNFGVGLAILLISLIIVSGSVVALVFRRITTRAQARENELRQQHS